MTRRKAKVPKKEVKKSQVPYPFPGTKNIRKLRHLFYATWFVKILAALAKKNQGTRPSSVFLFGVVLKEIVAALHRIYLNPNGTIFPVIRDTISKDAADFSQLVEKRRGGDPEKVLLQELSYAVENIVQSITEIMPKSGVLGTHKKAAVFELIRNGKRFPDGYFWSVEMDKLDFNESGRAVNIGDGEAFLLLIGIFMSRSLVSTLLLKPQDYGVLTDNQTQTAESNLQMLSTIFIFVVRRVSVPIGEAPMDIPTEISRYLYSDTQMRTVYTKMKKTLDHVDGLLRDWGAEYVRRLHVAAVSNFRV